MKCYPTHLSWQNISVLTNTFKKAPTITQDTIDVKFPYHGLGDCSGLLRNLQSLITLYVCVIQKFLLFSQITIYHKLANIAAFSNIEVHVESVLKLLILNSCASRAIFSFL